MHTLRNNLITLAAVAILAVVGSLMNSHQAAAQGPPDGLAVRIVNPLPVPTTGSTTVSGTVASTQSGTWSVNVNNPLNSPVPVRTMRNDEDPGRTPTDARSNGIAAGSSSLIDSPSTTQRVVVDFASATCVGAVGERFVVRLLSRTTPGTSATHSIYATHLVLTPQGTFSGKDISIAAQKVPLYWDPGFPLEVDVSSAGNTGTCDVEVIGHLITIP